MSEKGGSAEYIFLEFGLKMHQFKHEVPVIQFVLCDSGASHSIWKWLRCRQRTYHVFNLTVCRPRLLFQHQPYSEQDKLNLTDAEISAVVEGVFEIADGVRVWGVSLPTNQPHLGHRTVYKPNHYTTRAR